ACLQGLQRVLVLRPADGGGTAPRSARGVAALPSRLGHQHRAAAGGVGEGRQGGLLSVRKNAGAGVRGAGLMREPELAGQTVVLIGGSAGIGLETARRARAEGANVILTGRNRDRLERAASELGALSASFDASDLAALEAFFEGLEDPIDHVLVTAGGPYYATL